MAIFDAAALALASYAARTGKPGVSRLATG
jgi:hypothetical protein